MKNFTIGSFIISVICFIVGTMICGYVVSILWGWFVVPIFNLPLLSIPYAIGISMLVRYITVDILVEEGFDLEGIMTNTIAKALAALSVGWIVRLFI